MVQVHGWIKRICLGNYNLQIRYIILEESMNAFIRIIPVRYDSNRAGCKLTVVEEDFERVLDDEFWPDNITVREWTYRPPDNRDNDDGGATDSSDDNA